VSFIALALGLALTFALTLDLFILFVLPSRSLARAAARCSGALRGHCAWADALIESHAGEFGASYSSFSFVRRMVRPRGSASPLLDLPPSAGAAGLIYAFCSAPGEQSFMRHGFTDVNPSRKLITVDLYAGSSGTHSRRHAHAHAYMRTHTCTHARTHALSCARPHARTCQRCPCTRWLLWIRARASRKRTQACTHAMKRL
jgi:hypothetical protein